MSKKLNGQAYKNILRSKVEKAGGEKWLTFEKRTTVYKTDKETYAFMQEGVSVLDLMSSISVVLDNIEKFQAKTNVNDRQIEDRLDTCKTMLKAMMESVIETLETDKVKMEEIISALEACKKGAGLDYKIGG